MAPNDRLNAVQNTSQKIFPETTKLGFLPLDKTYSTKAIHGGYKPEDSLAWNAVPPISLSTTFKQPAPAEPIKYEYSRSSNSNREILEKGLAMLDAGRYGLCFSSGLGAATAILQTLRTGDHIICMDDVYGGMNRFFSKISTRFGICATMLDVTDLKELEHAIQSNTRMVWLESPTNPLLKIIDLSAVYSLVKRVNPNITVVVDNTFLTSYFQRPLSLGADVVVYSLTKYMNGHSDVVMGAIVTNNTELYEDLLFIQNASGIVPSPFDCYLVDRSLKTLSIRMKQHMKSGLQVATFLETHPMVEKVIFPGLPSHPQYELAKKQWSGCSGMLSFYLKGNLDDSKLFLSKLRIFICAESLGGYESLAELPLLMTHASVPAEQREVLKITENLVRLSVGLESVEDLIEDLDQALNAIKK